VWTEVRSVHSLINTEHTQIIEGDLADYFDSLPHAELMKSVARQVLQILVVYRLLCSGQRVALAS
jgi:retron-type reverse transcriptase